MKTYFIKDDNTETAEYYISKYSVSGKADMGYFDDDYSNLGDFHFTWDKAIEEIQSYEAFFAPSANTYEDVFEEEYGFGSVYENALKEAKKDKNTKAIEEIRKHANNSTPVWTLTQSSKEIDKLIEYATKAKSSIEKTISKFKSLGITK